VLAVPVTGVAGAVPRPAPSSGPRFVVGPAALPLGASAAVTLRSAPGTVAVLRPAGAVAFGTAPGAVAVLGASALALGAARALALGSPAAALALGACLVLGGARAAGALGSAVSAAGAASGARSTPASGLVARRRAVCPAPSAVASWPVARALGPATATVGIPSSFGTHVGSSIASHGRSA